MTLGMHPGDRSPIVLTVPGLGNSGPSHWQTLWERTRKDTVRVELGLWSKPHRNSWIIKLDQAIRAANGPVILAAHSLGCLAVAWWAATIGQSWCKPVVGALLVAPADVNFRPLAAELADFAPSPINPLPFPSILVASEDDPWITPRAAQSLASSWGSHFINAGLAGHLNAASGLGEWKEGQTLLERLLNLAGEAKTPCEARSIIAVSATEAASSAFLNW